MILNKTRYIEYINSLSRSPLDIEVHECKNNNGERLMALYIRKFDVVITRDKKNPSLFVRTKIEEFNKNHRYGIGLGSVGAIKSLAFVRVKDYKDSAKVFGITKLKKEMYESKQLFEIHEIIEEMTPKKEGVGVVDVVEVKTTEEKPRNIKFLLSDLEFVYPDIQSIFKGYTMPKDRTVKEGSRVVVYKKNKQGLPFTRQNRLVAKVVNIAHAGNKKYAVLETEKGLVNIDYHKVRVV